MGKRVRVIQKHATYGTTEAFNWKYTQFSDLLATLFCEVFYTNNDEYSDNFECEFSQYDNALTMLKDYQEHGRDKAKLEELYRKNSEKENAFTDDDANATYDEIDKLLQELGGLENVIKAMQHYKDERDKECHYISFQAI